MLTDDPRKHRPFYTADVKKYLIDRKGYWCVQIVPPGDVYKIRGIVRKHMGDVLPDRARKLVLGWLFANPSDKIAQRSTNDLLFCEVYALRDWIDPQNFGGVWLPASTFADELRWCARVAEAEWSKQHPNEPKQIDIFGGIA